MAASPDWVLSAGNDLRLIGDTLVRISRTLHEHSRKLEKAVDGKYANEVDDPRVQLLTDSLHANRMADLELGRLSQALQRVLLMLQQGFSQANGHAAPGATFEREREALNSSIINLKQHSNELETLYNIAHTLNSTLEFDEVLRLVMDRVIDFVNAERGFLMLVNPATGEPEFTIARNKAAQTIPESEFATAQISRGTVKRVINSREPLLADDAQVDDALRAQESIMAYGIRSIMCAPLVVRSNCIGVVYVDSRINANLFGPRHRDLLLAFCNQAAIAIDNARLFADLNKALQQVREDKQYMDNIFSSIANGVITTDSTGLITTFNYAAGAILNLNPLEALGKHYREVFKARSQVGLSALLQNANTQHDHGTIVPNAIDCEIPGRGLVNLHLYVSSLRDPQGTHIGMALVVDDRTELKRSEAQVKQIRRIFERYVHPNVVQQLIKDPQALNLGGETKEISVVFADIRGYTRLSESMPPEEVMNLINRYLKIMCEAIWEEEGTLTAFQGDALMAIFNAPLPQRNHALRAVRAAWKMRMAVLEYQRSQPQETQVMFGIGVNTGLATVGNVGSQERMQNYTAIGDTVNVASRLQNNVSDNNILLNEPSYMQVYRHVQVGQAFQLAVKNKSAPLTARYLLGVL
ncbi:MAG TPA: adenylate/guanylate cyclase domain-containing protein [Ktedonobacteraceae bacterium]|nr:adenylate/guanylate cyclase domain-containing protein [Ktedonobacteraceae bacterium]